MVLIQWRYFYERPFVAIQQQYLLIEVLMYKPIVLYLVLLTDTVLFFLIPFLRNETKIF